MNQQSTAQDILAQNMNWNTEWKPFALITGGFLVCFYLPVGAIPFDNPLVEAARLVKWYAREHVLLCLVPAFFIAGAIAVFVGKTSVLKYPGTGANKVLAYAVPILDGLLQNGMGNGPALALLLAGPALSLPNMPVIRSIRVVE